MSGNVLEIMHKNRRVAKIDMSGRCKIYYKSFMPYNLYLEEEEDIDTLVNNITNFYYWCATRVLTSDRKYAKEILNSIGMQQAVTDRDRAKIALSYRCASLTDVFWVRNKGEKISFEEINLYENHLENIFIDIALRGKQYTVDNENLAKDLSTNGVFPKAWKRTGKGFSLLKDGGQDAVERELLASRICQCFKVNQVIYDRGEFDHEPVTISKNITSQEVSIISMEAFAIYAQNHEKNIKKYILALDGYNYYMMNIVDYLIGNTDRHWGNWGVLVNNVNNKPISLHPLMDFNQSFQMYDRLDGANCQTCFDERMNQKQAALQAVERVGLNQIYGIEDEWFQYFPEYMEMFKKRLDILKR
ncbi:hypothetical protein LI216_04895 [Mediterraneibacter glycyrrhizinilyticus]|uniref:hypothetical protein n=1 Tax=Mediterraneibacter glycyrrhizinilyticus TaxID=342942 RepID=UPI001D0664FF|nr:hypothetical protein [Mediterraneibacter glycyrrhizinilyticus]MCB6309069.1 hypothetical protein [Lachnospiraceae bacterium 210521-DFI.1.109]MCB6426415.1 hypothetical protein [Mediterraneibacter glycyrrhizinilyticus]